MRFEAKTRAELERQPSKPKPGDAPPAADLDAFGLIDSAGSALHRTFSYATRKHTLEQIGTPHYFDGAREFGLAKWDMIAVTIGNDPATAVEVDLRVVSIGTAWEEPVTIAKGELRRFSLVNGDDKAKAA